MKDKLLDNDCTNTITSNAINSDITTQQDKSILVSASNLSNSNEENETDFEKIPKPNFIMRVKNKLAPGTLHGSMFSLALITLGSACLALPQKYDQMTLFAGIIATILGGIITYWTLNLLIISGLKHDIFDYSRLLKNLYGDAFGKILDIVIVIYTLGVQMLYLVICNIVY